MLTLRLRVGAGGLNLTLREIVCYKFSFHVCAAAATVRQRFSAARAFLTLGGFQKRNG